MAEYQVERYLTSQGTEIFRLPMLAFHDFWVYAFLIHTGDRWVLVDSGSGFNPSNDHLAEGFRVVSDSFGRPVDFDDLDLVLITHGHIDHFGGLPYVRDRTQAKIGVHELDQRNLTNIDERLILVSNRLNEFLIEAGASDPVRAYLTQIHKMSKLNYTSVPVDFTLGEHDLQVDGLELLHVPGHCPGQVVIRLHDILLSADHVLSYTTPHQAPERITLHTGLAHYLNSLESVLSWADGVSLTLGSHEEPIPDLAKRVMEIRSVHQNRLSKILDLVDSPVTIAMIADKLFGEVEGYDRLLALEEAGAHVEYLYQRGQLGVANYEEIDRSLSAVPWEYYRL